MAKILLVDDEPDIVRMLGLRMIKAGYQVITAGDGEDALDKLSQERPDVVLLDIHLPKIEGDEVARRMKQNEPLCHIPIIFITADARVQSQYADDYLIKPFDGEEMLRKIKKHIALAGRLGLEPR